MLPVRVCEPGAGFLCVDTPPGGVIEDSVTIRGIVDRQGQLFAGMKVVVQHDATKSFQELPVALEPDGRFTAPVALAQLGAYTVNVQAYRANGDPAVEVVRFSRIVPPLLDPKAIRLEPDPGTSGGAIAADHVTVAVDLLPACDACDFIGSTTGATHVTVINTITTPGNTTQRVTRTTNQGADGRFALCLPIGQGENAFTVIACNAATGLDPAKCPQAKLPPIRGGLTPVEVTFVQPDPKVLPVFDEAEYPNGIPIAFTVTGLPPVTDEGTCRQAPVTLEWNRERVVPLTAAGGVYRATVKPMPGVNLGVVHVQAGKETIDRPFTIGWGKIHSPWSAPGVARPPEEQWYPDALVLGVRQAFMAETMRGMINHVAQSDQWKQFLQRTIEQPLPPAEQSGFVPPSPMAERLAAIRATIPHCGATGGSDLLSQLRVRLTQAPRIGVVDVARVAFAPDVTAFAIEARDIEARVQLFRDADGNGRPDHTVIPLLLAFRKLLLAPEVRLVRSEPPLVLLTAATDDCAFKSGTYCAKRPALLLPQNFVGGATAAGGFVLCDTEGTALDAETATGCRGLNLVNAQTGLFNEKVLDALNQKMYCDGSALLTYFLREAFHDIRLHLGCHPAAEPAVAPGPIGFHLFPCGSDLAEGLLHDRHWDFPLGLDLVHSVFTLNERGMSARVRARAGAPDVFAKLPVALQQPAVGYLADPGAAVLPVDQGLSGERDWVLALAEGFFNQLLFLLNLQGDVEHGNGVLDWDLHEPGFRQLGFDFVSACDAFQPEGADAKPPALCSLRPRVQELLGSALTTAGYFSPKHPLLMRVRGNRAIAPRLRFFRAEVPVETVGEGEGGEGEGTPAAAPAEAPQCLAAPAAAPAMRMAQFIDLQIPELEVSLYALQVDPKAPPDAYGNPLLRRNATGEPQILSLRPNDPDPARGPIIRFTLTGLLALEVGDLMTDPTDPSRWLVTLTTNPYLSRLAFRVPPGGNATIVRDASLLSAVREKLLIGISLYGQERNAFRLRVPKQIALTPLLGEGELARLLGLEALTIGREGLTLGVDPGQDYLALGANFFFTQRLLIDGLLQEWQLPE